jgi:hypothetical protein
VWCAVNGRKIIGPTFFYGTVNLDHYVSSILELFFQMSTEEEEQYTYFQEDNTTSLHEIFVKG